MGVKGNPSLRHSVSAHPHPHAPTHHTLTRHERLVRQLLLERTHAHRHHGNHVGLRWVVGGGVCAYVRAGVSRGYQLALHHATICRPPTPHPRPATPPTASGPPPRPTPSNPPPPHTHPTPPLPTPPHPANARAACRCGAAGP